MRILLVEDDDGVANALVEMLSQLGHRVTRCALGAHTFTAHREADLVLLDLGLPDIDGFEVLGRLRRVSMVPVIVLTARGDERAVVRALRCGADDFVVKPIRQRELLARIDTVMRRVGTPDAPRHVQVDDVRVDLDARTVEVAGESVSLTATEFKILAVLARHKGIAVSRQQIMDEMWGNANVVNSRSLDVHMAALRAKLNRPGLIVTIRGFGYRFG